MGLLDWLSSPKDLPPLIQNLFGHYHRRVWTTNGRGHIELRQLSALDMPDFCDTLQVAMQSHPAVIWAQVNHALRRVIVFYNREWATIDELVEIVERVELRYHVSSEAFSEDLFDYPGDNEPLVQGIARMGADLVGAMAGIAMRLVGQKPTDRGFDLAAIVAVIDNTPHLRQYVMDQFGEAAADMILALTNPVIQGIGSGPITPILDIFFQGVRFMEALDRRRLWEDIEERLCADPERANCYGEFSNYQRPTAMPSGPIERYSKDAWRVSLGGFAVGLADTQDLKRALTPLLDALPKPARYGREAYCAQLGRVFSRRGVVCFEPAALRRLDRVSSVIIDGRLFYTEELRLDKAVSLNAMDINEVHLHGALLFNPSDAMRVQRLDGWTLGPLNQLDVELSSEQKKKFKQSPTNGPVFGLISKQGGLEALFQSCYAFDPGVEGLMQAVRQSELKFVLITDDEHLTRTFAPDEVVSPESNLVGLIRSMQRNGEVVCLVSQGQSEGLRAADCSMGLSLAGHAPSWGAHLIGSNELEDATLLVDACTEARRVSRQSTTIAGAGAGMGAISAIGGLEVTPPQKVMLAVNAASVVALANGIRAAETLARRPRAIRYEDPNWHAMHVDVVTEQLDTSVHGLSTEKAQQREIATSTPESKTRKISRAMIKELANPLTPVLAAGAAISAVVGSVTDAGIVGAVIGVNALVGGLERYKAEEVIDSLAQRETRHVRVQRDGDEVMLPAEQLVEGDVIRLEAGEVVPADCRIIFAETLEVDESNLTGESLPVFKSSEPTMAHAVAERTSMIYEGTAIAVGEVVALVVAVGDETQMRRASYLVPQRSQKLSGVERRLEKFTDLTLPFATMSGMTLLSLGVLRRQKLDTLIGPAVNLAVAAVPEGLPLLATAGELAAARRLSKRSVLVRNPSAMEALGRVNILCADKTGTLTEGLLRVHAVSDGTSPLELTRLSESHRHILAAALRATPESPEEGELPHATDRAIVNGCDRVDLVIEEGRRGWERLHELPFKSESSFHAVLGCIDDTEVITIKGAPEEVLPRCSRRFFNGKSKRLDKRGRARLRDAAIELAGQGLRILAIAEREFESASTSEFDVSDVEKLTFYGFVALSDPVRKTSAHAVRTLQHAGVDVMMITGDHSVTAARIAFDVGLSEGNGVLTGPEIDQMDDPSLDRALSDVTVIARATPNHKVRIVEALQRMGRVVAMTGDGGNDAAAIRLADVGIALGKNSASAARESADLVVTDERIETIVDAVVEGRAMWTSVRDAVAILIGGNLGEVAFMLLSGMFSKTPALNARQLLLVNLFTDVAPAMAIATREPPDVSEERLLHEGPEASLGEALNRDIIWRAAITGAGGFGAWMAARTLLMKQKASTVGLLSVVGAQLGQTLVAGKIDAAVLAAALGSAAGLLLIVETPGVSQLFGCKPLGPVGLMTAATASVLATAFAALAPRIIERNLAHGQEESPSTDVSSSRANGGDYEESWTNWWSSYEPLTHDYYH